MTRVGESATTKAASHFPVALPFPSMCRSRCRTGPVWAERVAESHSSQRPIVLSGFPKWIKPKQCRDTFFFFSLSWTQTLDMIEEYHLWKRLEKRRGWEQEFWASIEAWKEDPDISLALISDSSFVPTSPGNLIKIITLMNQHKIDLQSSCWYKIHFVFKLKQEEIF